MAAWWTIITRHPTHPVGRWQADGHVHDTRDAAVDAAHEQWDGTGVTWRLMTIPLADPDYSTARAKGDRRASPGSGPFARAFVGVDGHVVIPCSGVVQAGECLPIAQSAPDLLAALEPLIAEHDFQHANTVAGRFPTLECHCPEWNAARAAIAKARGA